MSKETRSSLLLHVDGDDELVKSLFDEGRLQCLEGLVSLLLFLKKMTEEKGKCLRPSFTRLSLFLCQAIVFVILLFFVTKRDTCDV